MSDRWSNLTPERRALLERRLREKRAGRSRDEAREDAPDEAKAQGAPAAEHTPQHAPQHAPQRVPQTAPGGDPGNGAGTAAWLPAAVARRAARAPQAVAAGTALGRLSYGELVRRAGVLAARLGPLAPETPVGVLVAPGLDLPPALLGVLAAGACCVPLDPQAGDAELAAAAAGLEAVVAGPELARRLPQGTRVVPWQGAEASGAAAELPAAPFDAAAAALALPAPGGGRVLLTHRGLAELAAAAADGAEAAVRLAAGAAPDPLRLLGGLLHGVPLVFGSDAGPVAAPPARDPVGFSLFYFASSHDDPRDALRLLVEGARFADRHGFEAVWTPERHFHPFGGLFPNPSVTSAALAAMTERLALRAGSVVLPLHRPIRVAEEWSFVDRLSNGRVGVAFASGWHAVDFALAPEAYAERRAGMFREIETVRRLWRGETVEVTDGAGNPAEVEIYPKPVQPELPVWITAAGNPATFVEAGRIGANLLTHLLGQSVEAVGERAREFRAARGEAGHDAEAGRVTLMLHAYVGEDLDQVRETVRGPFCDYIRSFTGLLDKLSASMDLGVRSSGFSERDVESLLGFAFERYFATSALFGPPRRCLELVERLRDEGVDEVACLVDFGVAPDEVLAGLTRLAEVREMASRLGRSERSGGARTAPGVAVSALVAGGAAALPESPAPLPPGLPARVAGAREGEDGELCLPGYAVRGWAGDARRTAERLVPDPEASEPGARLYRTGAAGRRREGAAEVLPPAAAAAVGGAAGG